MKKEEKIEMRRKLIRNILISFSALVLFLVFYFFIINVVTNTMMLASQKLAIMQATDGGKTYVALNNQMALFTAIKGILTYAVYFVSGLLGVIIGSLGYRIAKSFIV